ncbi:MAG: transglycosylase SLT domain-containing protein [Deltaproteobacteria bacterium]|nr:transglycosylase SLT domain-containing protein [Deltaproteobacteria bacterium]
MKARDKPRERGGWGGEGKACPEQSEGSPPPRWAVMLLSLLVCTGLKAKPPSEWQRLKTIIADDPLQKKAIQDIVDYWETHNTIPPPPLREKEKSKAAKVIPPPKQKGPPPSDLMLVKTSQQYCETSNRDQWQAWVATLKGPLELYWRALVTRCSQSEKQAISLFQTALGPLMESKSLHAYSLVGHQLLVSMQRRNAMRKEAAATYLDLINQWERDSPRPQDMGLTLPEFMFRKIDDYLFAARYRTLVGDYRKARNLTEKALTIVDASRSSLTKTAKDREALIAFEAEALHILAHRIAVEKKQYKKAVAFAERGLAIAKLPQEWEERFLWFQGLYHYMDKNLSLAEKKWTALLAKTNSPNLLPKLYFWLARIAAERGDLREKETLLTNLEEKFPLDFYSIVAPELAGIRSQELWQKAYGDPKVLAMRLNASHDYDLAIMRSNPEISMALLRAEIFVAAEMFDWAEVAAEKLYSLMTRKFPVARHKDAFLYLSRLLYAAGRYRNAIHVSEMLNEVQSAFWRTSPEQLYIYFPSSYTDVFVESAKESSVDVDLLYAIARQESLFEKDAASYAGALGLMQLIPTTARDVAKETGLDSRLVERLFEPDVNLKLGSRYLKKLAANFSNNPPAVIAAYNAGEFAVDRWLTQRQHEDTLLWVELIPFEETRHYVSAAWRNMYVYKFLNAVNEKVVIKRSVDYIKNLPSDLPEGAKQ